VGVRTRSFGGPLGGAGCAPAAPKWAFSTSMASPLSGTPACRAASLLTVSFRPSRTLVRPARRTSRNHRMRRADRRRQPSAPASAPARTRLPHAPARAPPSPLPCGLAILGSLGSWSLLLGNRPLVDTLVEEARARSCDDRAVLPRSVPGSQGSRARGWRALGGRAPTTPQRDTGLGKRWVRGQSRGNRY
jgi:hypothetical protein